MHICVTKELQLMEEIKEKNKNKIMWYVVFVFLKKKEGQIIFI